MKQTSLSLLILASILTVLTPWQAAACSCAYGGPFEKMAGGSQRVIRATVVEYGPKLRHGQALYESMTVTVSAVIKGRMGASRLTIFGDPGHLCRPYISPRLFGIGKEYLFALNNPGGGQQAISVCGEHWIEVDGVDARGRKHVDGKPVDYTVPLHELLSRIRQ